MINGKKVLAIIPARGGSKRLPRKNILPLHGKPLIAWTIEAALACEFIDDVIVSTDDQIIADISLQTGATVPELRPKDLSGDHATTEKVVMHILTKYGQDFDIVALLQPTSPLRTSEHINEAIKLLEDKGAHSIVSVTQCEHSPLWANTLPNDGNMKEFIRISNTIRSQDLGAFFRLNGAIYIYDLKELLIRGNMKYTEKTFAYKMDNMYSVDIDNQIDFDLAEFIIDKYCI